MARFRCVGSAGLTELCVFVAARSVRFRLRRALFGTWCRGTVLPPRFGLSIVLCPICQNLLGEWIPSLRLATCPQCTPGRRAGCEGQFRGPWVLPKSTKWYLVPFSAFPGRLNVLR